MSESQAAAQSQLAEVARELTAIRYRLLGVIATLGPREAPAEDEVATEVRSVVECVLHDRIAQAIADLLGASRYPAEPR